MKISKKLSQAIRKEITNSRFEILCALDDKDRTNKISHEVWRELYKIVIVKMTEMSNNIESEINTYSGKR